MKDPYIQENGTLKNKLGITEYKELNDAEKDIGIGKGTQSDSGGYEVGTGTCEESEFE